MAIENSTQSAATFAPGFDNAAAAVETDLMSLRQIFTALDTWRAVCEQGSDIKRYWSLAATVEQLAIRGADLLDEVARQLEAISLKNSASTTTADCLKRKILSAMVLSLPAPKGAIVARAFCSAMDGNYDAAAETLDALIGGAS